MTNNLVNIVSDYEYVLRTFKGNVLNLQAQFQSNEWAREELYIIAKELENTGKLFAERQGLGMSYAAESINGTQFSIINYHKTGNLINSIHAVVDGTSRINFFNDARNSRGQYYAGHIEYGFHDRSGKFVPARPFMRPALYAVAESSRGHLTGALKHFLEQGLWNGIGYRTLEFGHSELAGGKKRAFYQQAHMGRGAGMTGRYTSSGLFNTSRNAERHMSAFQNNSIIHKNFSTNRRSGIGYENYIGRDSRSRDGTRQRYTDSTKRFGHYTIRDRGQGRPSEGKMSHLRRTGKGRGRPATGRKSRRTGNPRGRKPKNSKSSKKPTRKEKMEASLEKAGITRHSYNKASTRISGQYKDEWDRKYNYNLKPQIQEPKNYEELAKGVVRPPRKKK